MQIKRPVLKPRDGLLVLSGYGIRVTVERRHLVVEDGVGRDRRRGALHHATSGLKRLVVIGHTGYVTFEALRWLADAGAAFLQIGADGEIVASFAAGGSNDVARRRAQVAAISNASGVEIIRALLGTKLRGQAKTLARFQAGQEEPRGVIDAAAAQLAASSVDEMRWHEAVAASAYWAALAPIAIRFPQNERSRLPEHWATVGPRTSPLTGRPRSAVTPFHAMVNYLYTILESEARIAISAAGLDPEVGLLHAERRSRNSFAHDLIEPLRPEVDQFLLETAGTRTFSVRDFVEARDGHCRLTPDLAAMLAHTGPRWAAHFATVLEPVIRTLESGERASRSAAEAAPRLPPARVGHLHRRTRAQGRAVTAVMPRTVCVVCGGRLDRGLLYCSGCRGIQQRGSITAARPAATAAVASLRAEGRDPTHGGVAGTRRGSTAAAQQRGIRESGGRSRNAARSRELFEEQIRPGLERVPIRKLIEATGLSPSYWSLVKRGKRVPHSRHWASLRAIAASAYGNTSARS